ncbi:MAG: hypothetical protein ABR950_10530 [Candidatus Dormibacteria bacterium]
MAEREPGFREAGADGREPGLRAVDAGAREAGGRAVPTDSRDPRLLAEEVGAPEAGLRAVGTDGRGLGLRVPETGLRVPGAGLRVPEMAVRVVGAGRRAAGPGLRVAGAGLRALGAASRVVGVVLRVVGVALRVVEPEACGREPDGRPAPLAPPARGPDRVDGPEVDAGAGLRAGTEVGAGRETAEPLPRAPAGRGRPDPAGAALPLDAGETRERGVAPPLCFEAGRGVEPRDPGVGPLRDRGAAAFSVRPRAGGPPRLAADGRELEGPRDELLRSGGSPRDPVLLAPVVFVAIRPP